MRVVFPRYQRQVRFSPPVLIDVNLCDAAEQLWEHEITVFRLLVMIIGSRSKHIGAVQRRHGLLLFRAYYQHNVIKSAHDPFGAQED